jgi:tetratricopeptide (TPR) repeat protein
MTSPMDTTECPTDEDLAAHLAGGRVDDSVAEHIDGCAPCRAVVVGAVRGGLVSVGVDDPEATTVDRPAGLRARRTSGGPPLEPGAMIGRYRIESLIGAGGMGVVYAAHDDALDRRVALKVMRPDLAGDPAALAKRLVRESRLMAKASHPAVLTVHDVGRVADRVFVAMELIRGETLGQWLARKSRAVDDIVGVFRRAGAGLVAAHRAGLVHRDFKPDNVLVELPGSDGETPVRVLVTDFGVARALAADDAAERGSRPKLTDIDLTATGGVVGTPAYMAPEQLAGADVDERADVFAFAVSLWESLHGTRPYPGSTAGEIRAAMDRGVPATSSGARAPKWIRRALLAALVTDRDARTPTMQGLLDALDPAPRKRRMRRAMFAGLAVLPLGAAAAVVTAWPRPQGARGPDPCADGLARLDAVWSPAVSRAAGDAILASGGDPSTIKTIDAGVQSWRMVHGAACKATASRAGSGDPTTEAAAIGIAIHRPADVNACLDARLIEIAALAEDLTSGKPEAVRDAPKMVHIFNDPAACVDPAPGLLEPRAPRDPRLRPEVARLRHALFAIETTRDAGSFGPALAAVRAIEREISASAWPPLEPEYLYLLGTIQSQGTDSMAALETFRRAAAVAERVHHDYLAAQCWIQLTQSAAFDSHDPERALEYAEYASAASARFGRPPMTEVLLGYAKGSALVEAGRLDEGRLEMEAVLALAEQKVPSMVSLVTQGLGYVYESLSRYDLAASTYRRALDQFIQQYGEGVQANEAVFRGRLAINLAQIGRVDEGIEQAEKGLEIAERTLDEKHTDRPMAHVNLADVLRIAGRFDDALAQIDKAEKMVLVVSGKRSLFYGEVLHLRFAILSDAGEYKKALPLVEKACEIVAFNAGDGATEVDVCWLDAATILTKTGRGKLAVQKIDAALENFELSMTEDHVQVAYAFLSRGEANLHLGKRDDAAKDFEHARARFASQSIEPGFLSSSEWGLARAIERDEPERAVTLAKSAIERWKKGPAMWKKDLAEAEAWVAARE